GIAHLSANDRSLLDEEIEAIDDLARADLDRACDGKRAARRIGVRGKAHHVRSASKSAEPEPTVRVGDGLMDHRARVALERGDENETARGRAARAKAQRPFHHTFGREIEDDSLELARIRAPE